MASLSEENIELAKSRARSHLSKSILTLAFSLGVDLDSLSLPLEIPISESDPRYSAYASLASQLEAINKI